MNRLLLFLSVMVLLQACKSRQHVAGSSNKEHAQKKEYYAKKFGLALDRRSNMRLYQSVDGWIGVRYKYASCSRSGVDCSCLVNAIYRETYSCNPPRDTKALIEEIKKLDRDELREGDLVFFKMAGKIDHVGIYLNSGKFVHASTKRGVMISSMDEVHFDKSFKFGGRLRCSS